MPIDGPTFVRGEVERIVKIDGVIYADVAWNNPNLSRRINVKKLNKLADG